MAADLAAIVGRVLIDQVKVVWITDTQVDAYLTLEQLAEKARRVDNADRETWSYTWTRGLERFAHGDGWIRFIGRNTLRLNGSRNLLPDLVVLDVDELTHREVIEVHAIAAHAKHGLVVFR